MIITDNLEPLRILTESLIESISKQTKRNKFPDCTKVAKLIFLTGILKKKDVQLYMKADALLLTMGRFLVPKTLYHSQVHEELETLIELFTLLND